MFGFGNKNRCFFTGNCGEIKYRGQDGSVMAFGLAINSRIKRGENYEDHTEWVNLVVFGKTAELAKKFVRKGSKIEVEARYQNRKWTDEEGNDRYSAEFVVMDLQLLDSKPSEQSAPVAPPADMDTSQDDVPF